MSTFITIDEYVIDNLMDKEQVVKYIQFGVYWKKKNKIDNVNYRLDMPKHVWDKHFQIFNNYFSTLNPSDYTLSKEESVTGLKELYNITEYKT